jgi:hypothetical protein
MSKLPQNAQTHTPPEQIEKRHSWVSGLRPAYGLAGFGKFHAILFVAIDIIFATKIIA